MPSSLQNWLTHNQDYSLSPTYLPIDNPSVVVVGLEAVIQFDLSDQHPINRENQLLGAFQNRVKITHIEADGFLWGESVKRLVRLKEEGYFDYEVNFDAPIRFHVNHIFKLYGSTEWELNNKLVPCSKKVIEGEKVGYFISLMYQEPLVINQLCFGVSEIDHPKNLDHIHYLPLSELVDRDATFLKYLDSDADYGAIRNSDNSFQVLSWEDIADKDRDVFPSAIED